MTVIRDMIFKVFLMFFMLAGFFMDRTNVILYFGLLLVTDGLYGILTELRRQKIGDVPSPAGKD